MGNNSVKKTAAAKPTDVKSPKAVKLARKKDAARNKRHKKSKAGSNTSARDPTVTESDATVDGNRAENISEQEPQPSTSVVSAGSVQLTQVMSGRNRKRRSGRPSSTNTSNVKRRRTLEHSSKSRNESSKRRRG